ncbi:ATP-binding cassette domain-containing protein [Solwaraspora sp. WMMD1047]|uniref:ATP-binding cassette domain-containing protein n=1 Tax=Solwaraspora sp. WMMD1047 TaxID=3016102 RepID=UPI0024171D56|nr:ATP-binding cassette domain-containing protein [Solwaraspora sp. WMMD1047]MDG4828592.1 ATP-binding cassette domain-containing protein [Solwaraspora sp. WMMD1047]
MGYSVITEGLRKRYGETAALDGLDLAVGAGTIHGLLGPNGAGKTTAVRILTTLLRPDGGRAEVAGCDVSRDATRVRQRIGLVGQHAAVDEVLSGRENLIMFGRLYHLGRRPAGRRADELLDRFDLAEAAGRPVGKYSGGMRRRLDLAASLILSPEVLFLDEPTTGLDPRGRNEVWSAIRALVDSGTTVLLTTQYLDEADQLAGRISVVDGGRVIADGTPDELKSIIGGDRLDIVLTAAADLAATAELLGRVTGTRVGTDDEARRISAPVADRVATLTEVVHALHDWGVPVEDIVLRRPTLDEVFLRITGDPPDPAPKQDPGSRTERESV